MSNFSEADLGSFTPDRLSDDMLLRFGLANNLINRLKSLQKTADGNSVIITSDQVDSATEKYFGRKVQQHRRKTYLRPLADGERYTFSQVNRLTDQGGGTYLADGVIYSTGSGGTPDPHGTPEEWKNKGEDVEQVGRFTAKLKAVDERYILLEYDVRSQ